MFLCKQKTAYEMRISDWSLDVCSSDLAGLAGLAVGAAAQPALKNLIAGIQMAFTEPIRIDDVVIIEGEWGRIEEIHLTFVIVKIWDERRLVVQIGRAPV